MIELSDFVLCCGSTADMEEAFFVQRNIVVAKYNFIINDVSYIDDFGKSMSYKDFYDRIRKGAMPSTSQIPVDDYLNTFDPILESGKDVLYITFSSGLSNSINSANIARNMLLEKYPEREILIADSFAASSGYGLLVTMAADLRDAGKTKEEIFDWVEKNRLTVNHWFFSTDLQHYKRGGRISATSAMFGTVLNICPLMDMNNEGKLIPRMKVRGKNNVIKQLVDKMIEKAVDGKNYSGLCYISNSDCFEDALAVKDLIEENFPNLKGKILINNIGTVIGSHTGPGTVALFFVGDERKE